MIWKACFLLFFPILSVSAGNGAEEIVGRIRNAMKTKDPNVISTLFYNTFVFDGCNDFYNYTTVVRRLAKSNYQFELKNSTATNYNTIIVLNVTAGSKHRLIKLTMGNSSQKFTKGRAIDCPNPKDPFDYDPHGHLSIFMDKVLREILVRDANKLQEYFEPTFTFRDCDQSVFSRDEIVKKLVSIPRRFVSLPIGTYELNGNLVTFTMKIKIGTWLKRAKMVFNKKSVRLVSGACKNEF